jgi:hypothetical protein
MFFFTITNLRKKCSIALKLGLVLVLVVVLLPYLHGRMLEVNAMNEMLLEVEIMPPLPEETTPEDAEIPEQQRFAQAEAENNQEDEDEIQREEFPGEPVRVDGQLWLPLTFWQELAKDLSY